MEEKRWAAAYYRVERDSTGVMMRKGPRKKATKQAIEHGEPVPSEPHDVVRIYDREGEVVFSQDWGSNRPDSMAHEARIVDDLLKLDVLIFCAKYGIAEPPLPEPAVTEDRAEGAGMDPDDGSEARGQSEQGSG